MNSRSIPLTQGKFAIVDEDDFEKLSPFKWHAYRRKGKTNYYARRGFWKDGKWTVVAMQNVICPPPKGKLVDHKNGNSLDNRKSNLRLCTTSQNAQNKRKMLKKGTSIYKGVYRSRNRWAAHIGARENRRYLGRFDNEMDAALAYDEVARQRFGEFALVNFP